MPHDAAVVKYIERRPKHPRPSIAGLALGRE
jgi:hypothetical protein